MEVLEDKKFNIHYPNYARKHFEDRCQCKLLLLFFQLLIFEDSAFGRLVRDKG